MPTKDDFDPRLPLPLFLTHENEPEQPSIGKALDGTVIWPRLLKATTLVATATAITIAILSTGNPVALFADVTASVVDNSAVQPTDQSTPSVQSTADADAKALPPTAKDAFRAAYEIAAASEPAVQIQPENSELSSEALFKEYQAWAAEKDAQAPVAVQEPVLDAPAKTAGNARASLRIVHKHRQVKPIHNARAEMAQNHRKKIRREHIARVAAPPAQDAPAQVQYVQNPFLQLFDWRN